MICLFRNLLIGFFIILTSYIHCQEYGSTSMYESSEFGLIAVIMDDENNLEIVCEKTNDYYDCECDVSEFILAKNISDNIFYTKDKSITLSFIDDDIIIKNKKSDLCCQLGTGLYVPYINHRWDEQIALHEETDLEETDSEETDSEETDSEETDTSINNNLNFLNGYWKDNYHGDGLLYDLQYNESENILNIFNEDDEVIVSLSQVSICGSYDLDFTILMTSGENCWYIDNSWSDVITIWTLVENELEKRYELEKLKD